MNFSTYVWWLKFLWHFNKVFLEKCDKKNSKAMNFKYNRCISNNYSNHEKIICCNWFHLSNIKKKFHYRKKFLNDIYVLSSIKKVYRLNVWSNIICTIFDHLLFPQIVIMISNYCHEQNQIIKELLLLPTWSFSNEFRLLSIDYFKWRWNLVIELIIYESFM